MKEPSGGQVHTGSGFLLLATSPAQLALPSALVLSITNAEDWSEAAPPALDQLLAVTFVEQAPRWILRIDGEQDPWVATATGQLQVEYYGEQALLAMPRIGHGFSLYSNVVLKNEAPTALIVNVSALLQRHRELES